MKQFIEYINSQNIIFKYIEAIEKKKLGTRKDIIFYKAIDIKSRYWFIVIVGSKTKLLRKDIAYYEELLSKMINLYEHNFAIKALFFKAEICSLAKKEFTTKGWKLYYDFM